MLIIAFNAYAKGLEIDFALNSEYEAETTRKAAGLGSSNGEATLTGSDIRFAYIKDENLSYGLRLADHDGKDNKGLTGGYSYSISIKEQSPFVKYSIPFNSDEEITFDGYGIAGLNLATIEISHNLLSQTEASTTGFMLELGLFGGFKNDKMTIGGGVNLPLDGYEAEASWNILGVDINYDVEIKKNITFYLGLKIDM